MKKIFILFFIFLLLIFCGGDKKLIEVIIEFGNLEMI